MKFPKFVNKKMIIFVVLFVAFVYFSGILYVIREGYTVPPNTLKAKDMDCSKCLNNGVCSEPCKKFISDNNITTSKHKNGIFYSKNTYFEPKNIITMSGNCSGCSKTIRTRDGRDVPGTCDTICDKNINYPIYKCIFKGETNKTTCTLKKTSS